MMEYKMRRKSILEEVEAQEKKRKEAEKFDKRLTTISKVISFFFLVGIIGGAYYLFKPKEITEEERQARVEAQKVKAIMDRLTTTCEDQIKESLHYPSTYKKHLLPIVDRVGEAMMIKIAFTAKNGLGVEIPQYGICKYQNGFLQLQEISNR